MRRSRRRTPSSAAGARDALFDVFPILLLAAVAAVSFRATTVVVVDGFVPPAAPPFPGRRRSPLLSSAFLSSRAPESLVLASSSQGGGGEEDEVPDFSQMKVTELKEELREIGLTTSGLKKDLVARLEEYYSSTSTEEEEEEEVEFSEEADAVESSSFDSSSSGPSTTTSTFESLGLNSDLVRSARSCGWDVPTPIQTLAVKPILDLALGGKSRSDEDADGHDSVWCEAPTGSGKTACFALPLVQALVRERRDRIQRAESLDGKVSCLVLCPTRELASQIGGVFRDVSDGMPAGRGVDVMTIHGGVPIDPQVEALAARRKSGKGLEVLVATPGRLADVLRRGEKEDQAEAVLERKLLAALDATGRSDASLSLATIEDMELDPTDDMGRSEIHDMLEEVRYLVLDEADRLLGQPFRSEMDNVLELLPSAASEDDDEEDEGERERNKMKTLLFSATFPEQILPRVESVLHQLSGSGRPPLRLSAALAGTVEAVEGDELSHRRQKRLAKATRPSSVVEGPASTIALRTIRIEEPRRTMALRRLLEEHGGNNGSNSGSDAEEEEVWDRVLVFVSTRYASEHVSRKLRRAGIRSTELHGKLDQDARDRRLNDFRKGKVRVLVATDLASRGLDVQGLPAVVNYDLPRSTADFTHRVGRTGRAGRKGTAVSFVTPSNEAHFDLIEKRHYGSKMGEREVLEGFEPNEEEWNVRAEAARLGNPGAEHSERGLAHDRMYGGVKGRRKSKKDRLREKAAREKAGAGKKRRK